MDRFEVQPDACRQRQARLQQIMQERGVDLAVVTLPEHVQYLAGPRFGPLFQPVAALTAEGHLTLVAPARRLPEIHAADEVLPYEAQWHSTLRNDQRAEAIGVLEKSVSFRGVNRVGVEFSSSSRHQSWTGPAKPSSLMRHGTPSHAPQLPLPNNCIVREPEESHSTWLRLPQLSLRCASAL